MPVDRTDELIIRAALRDELTAPLAGVRAELAATAAEVAKINAEGAAAGSSSGGLARMAGRMDGLQKLAGKVHGGLLNISSTLGGMFSTGLRTAAVGLGALTVAVGVFGVKSASNFEQTRIALDGMLGSAAKGQAMFDSLKQLNMRTPFQLQDVTAGARQLIGFQFQPEQIIPILKATTDIAAGLGSGSEGLQRMLLNLGQVQAAGKVTGRELRDFAVLGVPGYALVANILGKTKDEVIKMGDSATVTADQFVNAWVKMQGPLQMFGGMAEKQMVSLQGLWSNVKDSFQVGMSAAAGPLVDSLKGVLGPDGALSKFISEGLASVGPPLARFGGQLLTSITALLPALLPIFTALADGATRLLQAMAPGFAALQPVAGDLAVSIGELVTALVPVMPTLVTTFVDLVKVLPTFVGLLADLVPLITPMLNMVNGLLELGPVRDILAGVLAVLLGYRVLTSVATAITAVATAMGGLATATTVEADAEAAAATTRAAAGAGGLGGLAGKLGPAIGIGLGAGILGKAAGGAIAGDSKNTRGGKMFSNTVGVDAGLIATGARLGGLGGAVIGAGAALGYTGFKLFQSHTKPKSYWQGSDTAPVPNTAYISPTSPASVREPAMAGGGGGLTVNGPLVQADKLTTDVDVTSATRRALAEADRQARERN